MRLPSYLQALRRGWAVVLLLAVIGVALGVTLTLLTKPTYKANVQIFVATNTSDTAQLSQGNTFTEDRVQSYVSIANSPKVTAPVITMLGLKLTDSQLAAKITADAPQSTVLINLHVTDHDPVVAARIANAVATKFAAVVVATETVAVGDSPPVRLTPTRPATAPETPVSPRPTLNIVLGGVLGLLLGVGIVLIRDALDDTVKGASDFEALNIPVLGLVPFDRRAVKDSLAFRSDPHSGRSEAYRAVRTNMQFVDVDNPPRLIAVTSAVPAEGKTTTSINLAGALAEAGYRVCLIDADLRRPSVAKILGLIGDVGFTSVLIGDAPLEAVLQNAGRNLAVMASGPIPPNPSELLASEHARAVLAEIVDAVDFCVIDTPPLLPVTDAAQLSTVVDATVLVNRAGKTTVSQTKRAIASLAAVGTRPVGVVVNMITRRRGVSEDTYGYYYTYSYEPITRRESRRRRKSKGDDATATATTAAETPVEGEEILETGATDGGILGNLDADAAQRRESADSQL